VKNANHGAIEAFMSRSIGRRIAPKRGRADERVRKRPERAFAGAAVLPGRGGVLGGRFFTGPGAGKN
jgi:hypothetical protein